MKTEPTLNPNIETLPKGSMTEQLYNSFVDIAERANDVAAPDFSDNLPMKKDENGNQMYDPNDPVVPLVDTEGIEQKVAEYSEIQMKNYAYDMANAIMSAMGGSGSSGGGSGDGGGTTNGFLPLAGGTLSGQFTAKHGVDLGADNKRMLALTLNGDGDPIGYFEMIVDITGDTSIKDGKLSLDDQGIYFNKYQSIYIANQTLNIDYQKVKITGTTEIDGKVTIGDIVLESGVGISFQGNEYYHAGNSNTKDVDWTAKDLSVYGNLTVKGTATLSNRLSALFGFDLGECGDKYFYSTSAQGIAHLWTSADITMLGTDNGLKYDGCFILKTGTDSVSFSAPGKVLRLGDSDVDEMSNVTPTNSISLQAKLNTADNAITLITPDGVGYFLQLTAKSASGGDEVLKTYRIDTVNEGVLFKKRIALYDTNGVAIYSDNGTAISSLLPFTYMENGTPTTDKYWWSSSLIPTDSLFRDQQISTPTVNFDTDAQFFRFSKPTEAQFFSIISTKYKTSLEEGRLFLNNNGTDSLFLQAVSNGIFHSGNATFNHSLSSVVFTSGFAGAGWAILEDALTGNFGATFDELTVRKKMRIYELEVQKINVTNGSWWVTDSCAGDIVEEV